METLLKNEVAYVTCYTQTYPPAEEILEFESEEPINLEHESLFRIYKAFRGTARFQDFKLLEQYLAAEEKQEIERIIANMPQSDYGSFWKFFDYPPYQRITYVSESKSSERGDLHLRYNHDDEKQQKRLHFQF